MCIYCGTKKYRKIYENHYGSIPKDEDGRTYDIHHLDGDHSNNNPKNLKAVSIKEHYDIHYNNGDFASCIKIGLRINKSVEEISQLSTLHNLKRVKNGTHPWLGGKYVKDQIINGTHPFLKRSDGTSLGKEIQQRRVKDGTHQWIGDGTFQKNVQIKRVKDGTHNFLGSPYTKKMYEDGTHPFIGGEVQKKSNQQRLKNGTHHLLGGNHQKNQLANGTHPSQVKWTCEICNKSGSGSANYKRWHGDKCKNIKIKN